jgi:hypothetical protein
MSDQNGLTLAERAKLEMLAIFARRQMLTDGSIDQERIADEIEPTITSAVVQVEGDRSKVGVSPTLLMERHFSEVPSKDRIQTDDEDELEFVDAVYGNVKGQVFRVLNIMPDGPIQSRLANNGSGLVLCRMKGKRGTEEVAYVTRNRKCIDLDNNKPAFKQVALAVTKAAALTGLSIDRVPEHGKWFQRQYNTETKQITDGGQNTVRGALESVDTGDDYVADDDE